MDEARKTCLILREFPVSLAMRREILHQRHTENAAHESYLVARKQLFEAAHGMESCLVFCKESTMRPSGHPRPVGLDGEEPALPP